MDAKRTHNFVGGQSHTVTGEGFAAGPGMSVGTGFGAGRGRVRVNVLDKGQALPGGGAAVESEGELQRRAMLRNMYRLACLSSPKA